MLIIAPLLLSTLPTSQHPAPTPEAPPARVVSEEDARPRMRVLHLVGGETIRARARFVHEDGEAGPGVPGHWEVERAGTWHALREGQVERAKAVADIEAEGKRLVARLELNDAQGRLGYADWLFHEGLVPEAVEQLDRVLELEPELEGAHKLLAHPRLNVALPAWPAGAEEQAEEARAAYFEATARLGRAGRELAIRALETHGQSDALFQLLAERMNSTYVRERVFATQVLRRMWPGDAIVSLVYRSVLDADKAARREAALGLGNAGQAATILPLIDALESDSPVIRMRSIEAMGNAGYPEAVASLASHLAAVQSGAVGVTAPRSHINVTSELAYIQDVDVEIAQGASIADPIVGTVTSGVILDARVIGLEQVSSRNEMGAVAAALRSLTGASPGRTDKAWLQWWEQNRGDYPGGGSVER